MDLESYQEEIGISPNVLGPTPNNGVGLFFVLIAISLTASCIVDKELDLNKGLDPVVTVVPGMKVIFGDTGTLRTDVILFFILSNDGIK